MCRAVLQGMWIAVLLVLAQAAPSPPGERAGVRGFTADDRTARGTGSVEGVLDLPAPPLVTSEGDVARFARVVELEPAPEVAEVTQVAVTPSPTKASSPSHHFLGVQLDVALPDGAGASVLLMPVSWLRVQLGGMTNTAGAGMRLGLSLVAFPSSSWFRPTLTVDAGTYFTGDASWLAGESALAGVLKQVSYQFVSGHAGFELGSRHVAVVVRGGLSYVDATLGSPQLDVGTSTLRAGAVHVRGVIPSLKLGLMFCFL